MLKEQRNKLRRSGQFAEPDHSVYIANSSKSDAAGCLPPVLYYLYLWINNLGSHPENPEFQQRQHSWTHRFKAAQQEARRSSHRKRLETRRQLPYNYADKLEYMIGIYNTHLAEAARMRERRNSLPLSEALDLARHFLGKTKGVGDSEHRKHPCFRYIFDQIIDQRLWEDPRIASHLNLQSKLALKDMTIQSKHQPKIGGLEESIIKMATNMHMLQAILRYGLPLHQPGISDAASTLETLLRAQDKAQLTRLPETYGIRDRAIKIASMYTWSAD